MKITICNSGCFIKNAQEVKKILEGKGHSVVTHLDKMLIDGKELNANEYYVLRKQEWNEQIEKIKNELIKDHFEKIIRSDAILVLNLDKDSKKNYIGGNVLMEMGVAFALNKKIFLMNHVPENLSYTEEIKGMKPIILNGDIEKIR